MSWAAPRTYVAEEVVTAAILNVDLRDNMLVVSSHAHGGAAGAGNDELAGVDSIAFDDLAASPDAAGELQRNGVNLEWYGAAVVAITEADAAAATASPRTLGTGALQAATGNHSHTISQSQAVNDPASIGAVSRANSTQRGLNTLPATLCTAAITVGGTGKHALVYSGAMVIYNGCTHSPTYTLTVKRGGVSKGTASSTVMASGTYEIVIVQALEQDVAAGAYTITLDLSASVSDGDLCDEAGGALAVSEVTI